MTRVTTLAAPAAARAPISAAGAKRTAQFAPAKRETSENHYRTPSDLVWVKLTFRSPLSKLCFAVEAPGR